MKSNSEYNYLCDTCQNAARSLPGRVRNTLSDDVACPVFFDYGKKRTECPRYLPIKPIQQDAPKIISRLGDIPADFERFVFCHTCQSYDDCDRANSNFICADYNPEEDVICCGSCENFKDCGKKSWDVACRKYATNNTKYSGGRK